MKQSPWPERDDALREHWAAGLTTVTIADRMGLSKNAVIGRVHRLHLPSRPSPIRPKGSGAAPKVPRVSRVQTLVAREVVPEAVPVVPVRWAVARTSDKSCCWPIGEPRTPAFRFCDAPGLRGKPYCAEHCAIAYPHVAAPRPRTDAQLRADEVRRLLAQARWKTVPGGRVGANARMGVSDE